MMKRSLLLAAGLCLLSAPAWAVCGVSNLQVKDNAAVTAAVPYGDDGSGGSNCSPQIQIKQGGNVAGVTAGGAIKTDASATTQPVSGTVTVQQGTAANLNATVTGTVNAAQSSTWTVQPGNTANTTPWLTTSRIVGNAGATLDFAGQNAASPANSQLMGGQFNTTPTTIASGNASPLQLDSAGNLLVNVKAGGASGGTSSTFGSAFPGTGTAIGASDGTNMQSLRVTTYGTAPTGLNALAVNANVTNANSNGQAVMTSSAPVVTASDQTGSCTGVIPINQTASTDVKTSVAKLNICSIILVSASAQNISVVEGTGTTCATGTAALVGGTTASMAVAANGGFSAVSSVAWLKTQTTADHLCVLQSGAGNVSGVITYLDHS